MGYRRGSGEGETEAGVVTLELKPQCRIRSKYRRPYLSPSPSTWTDFKYK